MPLPPPAQAHNYGGGAAIAKSGVSTDTMELHGAAGAAAEEEQLRQKKHKQPKRRASDRVKPMPAGTAGLVDWLAGAGELKGFLHSLAAHYPDEKWRSSWLFPGRCEKMKDTNPALLELIRGLLVKGAVSTSPGGSPVEPKALWRVFERWYLDAKGTVRQRDQDSWRSKKRVEDAVCYDMDMFPDHARQTRSSKTAACYLDSHPRWLSPQARSNMIIEVYKAMLARG